MIETTSTVFMAMRRFSGALLFSALIGALLLGCSDGSDGTGGVGAAGSSSAGTGAAAGTGSMHNMDPQVACMDFIEAEAMVYDKCDLTTYDEAVALLQSVFMCEQFTRVTDPDRLYDECIPAVEALPCDQIQAGMPDSCFNVFD